MNERLLYFILFGLPALVLAFTFHEWAHAFVAFRHGDPTAKYEGRLSLDPRKHVDPIGGLVLLLSMIMSGGQSCFGWAKPVPVNTYLLRGGRRSMMMVSLAGPMANLVTAAVFGLLFRLGIAGSNEILYLAVHTIVVMNIGLALFNLIPIPPLDGWGVLQGIVPESLARRMAYAERAYAMFIPFIFAFFILSPLASILLSPSFVFLYRLFTSPL